MNKNFVPYEIAEQLNKLGFDEPCIAYYTYTTQKLCTSSARDGYSPSNGDIVTVQLKDLYKDYILAPLWQEVFDWFRIKIGVIGIIDYDEIDGQFMYYLTDMNDWSKSYPTYEEARIECLKRLIKQLI